MSIKLTNFQVYIKSEDNKLYLICKNDEDEITDKREITHGLGCAINVIFNDYFMLDGAVHIGLIFLEHQRKNIFYNITAQGLIEFSHLCGGQLHYYKNHGIIIQQRDGKLCIFDCLNEKVISTIDISSYIDNLDAIKEHHLVIADNSFAIFGAGNVYYFEYTFDKNKRIISSLTHKSIIPIFGHTLINIVGNLIYYMNVGDEIKATNLYTLDNIDIKFKDTNGAFIPSILVDVCEIGPRIDENSWLIEIGYNFEYYILKLCDNGTIVGQKVNVVSDLEISSNALKSTKLKMPSILVDQFISNIKESLSAILPVVVFNIIWRFCKSVQNDSDVVK